MLKHVVSLEGGWYIRRITNALRCQFLHELKFVVSLKLL